MRIKIFLVFFPVLAFLISSCKENSSRFSDREAEELNLEIKALSESLTVDSERMDQFLKDVDLKSALKLHFADFYKSRNYTMAWVGLDGLLPQGEALINHIKKAESHGLDSNTYNIKPIRALTQSLFYDSTATVERDWAKEYVRLDFTLTAAYLTYASHMLTGIVNPEQADSNWVAYPKEINWANYLKEALEEREVAQSIEALAPTNTQYDLLKKKLMEYKTLAEEDELPTSLPAGISVEPGDSAQVIATVKAALNYWEDLPSSALDSSSINIYDKNLEDAIANFQERHGILEDGKIGPETISILNTSIDQRIAQIALNMERLRWLPEDLGNHYIWVNIPDFQLKVVKDQEERLNMRVIVGESMNETPIFSDTVEFVVFSPTWTVPLSISVEEMLPKIREEDDFFEERNFILYESWDPDAKEINPEDVKWKDIDEENFTFKIVERPGEGNALGAVKFMFPNSEAIYLHDTPTDHLFEERERGFSHGCIRVESPRTLAEYLLDKNSEEWDMEKITEHMELDSPTTVTLERRLPVHIVYHTSWVDDKNRLHFRKDVYSHDKTQQQAIRRKEALLM